MTFLHTSSRTITSAAFLLATAALASRFLGLLRDRILADRFGAGDELDIYFAAFRIPDLLYNIVIAGAISAAFVPVFISIHSKDKKMAWRTASNFFNISVVALILVGCILAVVAPLLIPYVAPGFDAQKAELTVNVARIMFLSPLFLGMSAILGGVLHSFKRFFAYALAPVFYNSGIIFGALVLSEPFGVYGLAWGVVVGSALHFAIHIPSAIFSGFSWQNVFDVRDQNFRKIFLLMIPRSFGLAIFQLNLWVITAIASMLSVGSIAIFNLANHLQFLVIGIVGYSFSTAAMPSFAKSMASPSNGKMAKQFLRTVKMVLFLVVPMSILMFVLRAHVVRLAFGSGEFGWDDTRLTAATLGIFCIGIFAHSLIPLFSKAFYAMQNTKTPVLINSVGFFINIALGILFVFVLFRQPGVSEFVSRFLDMEGIDNIALLGLPLAFAISGIFNLAMLAFALLTKLKEKSLASVLVAGAKILLVSLIAGFVAYGALIAVEPFLNTRMAVGLFLQASIASIVAGLVYIAIMAYFRSPELSALINFRKRKDKLNSEAFHESRNGNVF